MNDVVGVLLAAGAGSRFDGSTHKLLATLPATGDRPEETVIARATASIVRSGLPRVVIITGALDLQLADLGLHASAETGRDGGDDAGRESGRDHAADNDPIVTVVRNPRWADGQATSVQAAVSEARRLGASSAVIGLGDQPGVLPDTWRRIAEAATDAIIAAATYDGRRGNPVALGSGTWDLLPTDGDEGARTVMHLRPDLVVEVPCSGSSDDIDTTEDLRRWQNNSSTNSP